jgi:hypothetical protein
MVDKKEKGGIKSEGIVAFFHYILINSREKKRLEYRAQNASRKKYTCWGPEYAVPGGVSTQKRAL